MKVGIAGAGIIGQLLAFRLINEGFQITLFDDNLNRATSRVAAGMLSPITELEKCDTIIFQLGYDALTIHWPHLMAQLDSAIYFKKEGSVVLAHANDVHELSRLIRIIQSKLPDHKHYQKLDQSTIHQLEPEIKSFYHGLYVPHEGQVDAQAVLLALQNTLIKRATYLPSYVQSVDPYEIKTKDQSYHFDLVCDCRGIGAKKQFSDLHSIRGELIWVHAPHVTINHPIRLMHPRYRLYIVPRHNHDYLIGSSEIETSDTSPVSVRTTLELLSAAFSIHSGFGEARIVKMDVGIRPTLPDHLPKMKYKPGYLAINGCYRNGFLIAPTLLSDVMIYLSKGMQAVRYPTLWEHDA